MKKKAVVLLSGGLDSTTCLAYAKSKGFDCYALSFYYGQKHSSELESAKNIAQNFGVLKHEIVSLDFISTLYNSSLTDQSKKITPYSEDNNSIPSTYVPARNTIMLSTALGWAETLECSLIFIGVSSVDYSGYPDCRPEYIKAFNKMANLATKNGVSGNPIQIETPLIKLSKAETIKLGLSLNVDYSETISCYQATIDGFACGICDSCFLRKKGFEDACAGDPTKYIDNPN